MWRMGHERTQDKCVCVYSKGMLRIRPGFKEGLTLDG